MDISAGGLAVKSNVRAHQGEPIIFYLDLLGRFEGIAVRELPDGFAVELKVPPGRHARLQRKLAFLYSRKTPVGQIRMQERLVPKNRVTNITIGSANARAEVIDISRSGAGLVLPFAVTKGTFLTIGASTKARIVQVNENTAGVEFCRLIPIEEFDINFEF
jgi:hypothetical protein